MLGEALGPNLLVLGALLGIAAAAPHKRNAARTAFVGVTIAAMLRYVWWRWTSTLPDQWWTITGGYAAACFIFELAVSANLILGMVVLSRATDRRAEADDGEAWARSQPDGALASVDVLIPTYNEDREVLERTIVGAIALDYPNLTVWVLDDGRRPWVAELAAAKGARYLTRSDNAHAKAGNINAALSRTKSDLILVLDADFVPRANMLWRTVGFFRDPRIACVQTPQYFFNKDPTQTNLGLSDRWADDQRLFFDVIMPSRDAWGAAFCCGTGFVILRGALEAIGGMPTKSVCEDMLLSIDLKRRGLETIYLKEELCIGLAPESVRAFFVQRRRWARGQIQIARLTNGVFGPGLPWFYRLLFLPGYWLLQLPARIAYVLIPIIFLLFGLAPLYVDDLGVLIGHLGPGFIGSTGLMMWLGRQCYFPILTDANSLFLALRVVPTAFLSLVKPFGVPFGVTPKGAAAQGQHSDQLIVGICLGLVLATLAGLVLNSFDDWRVVQDRTTLAFASFWALVNCVIVGIVAMIAREGPRHRAQERFAVGAPARCVRGAEPTPCRVINLSSRGAFVDFGNYPVPEAGSTLRLSLPHVGEITGIAVRRQGTGAGIRFLDVRGTADAAINRLAAAGQPTASSRRAAIRVPLDARARLIVGGEWSDCVIGNASVSGALLIFPDAAPAELGESVLVDLPQVGMVDARVVRVVGHELGLRFAHEGEDIRDNLIRFLYTAARRITLAEPPKAASLLTALTKRFFGPDLLPYGRR